jgi:hypothetical protein
MLQTGLPLVRPFFVVIHIDYVITTTSTPPHNSPVSLTLPTPSLPITVPVKWLSEWMYFQQQRPPKTLRRAGRSPEYVLIASVPSGATNISNDIFESVSCQLRTESFIVEAKETLHQTQMKSRTNVLAVLHSAGVTF